MSLEVQKVCLSPDFPEGPENNPFLAMVYREQQKMQTKGFEPLPIKNTTWTFETIREWLQGYS